MSAKMYFIRFYSYCLKDLVTCAGGWEILSVSGRLMDNLAKVA